MVKVFENAFNYDYSFPAVTLAYFLRYPNPYSTHVISSDVIDRHFDPLTQRLHTTRLHLKGAKLPSAIVKLLPSSLLSSSRRNGSSDARETYVLEHSVVDIKEGVMTAESRNLEWTGILSIVERQRFSRPRTILVERATMAWDDHFTDVNSSMTLISRLGQARQRKVARRRRQQQQQQQDDGSVTDEPKQGFFASLSSAGLQRSIEMIGLQTTRDQLRKSQEGMKVVLERMRSGGLGAVLEGMRHDRMAKVDG